MGRNRVGWGAVKRRAAAVSFENLKEDPPECGRSGSSN